MPDFTREVPGVEGNINSVVSKIDRKHGGAHGPGSLHRTSYMYHGPPLESTKNWGYLGFYGMRITDERSGIVTYHQYRLDFPHFGEVSATHQYDDRFTAHNELLTKTETNFDTLRLFDGVGGTYLPYRETVTNRLLEGGTEIGVVQYKNVVSQLDSGHGFLRSLDTTTVVAGGLQVAEPAGSVWGNVPRYNLIDIKRSVATETEFVNEVSSTSWLIGFREDFVRRHYRGEISPGNFDQAQWAVYTRHPGTNEIATEVLFERDLRNELTTSYGYDSLGNLTTETTSGVGVASRTSTANNHVQGRYPSFVRNALNHRTDLVFDERFGRVKTVTDPNGRQTTVVYDGFGREVSRTTPDNVVISTSYDWCGAVSCESVSGIAPRTRVQTSSAVSPTTRRYLDKLGREIRSEVESLSGAYIRQDTEYDSQGRIKRVSQPYLVGSPAHFVSYEYDIRDRIVREDHPDGSYMLIHYTVEPGIGVRTTVQEQLVDGDGVAIYSRRFTTNIYNLMGELVTKIDDDAPHGSGLSATTDYEYFASGLPRTVTVDPAGASLVTTYQFDDAGNQLSITGPDIGTVTSEYTALGQLEKQTDNGGNVLEWSYDLLGRVSSLREGTTTTTPATTATWSYDPTNGIGLLYRRAYNLTEFVETFTYGVDARPSSIATAINIAGFSKSYTHSMTYRADGRLDTVTYPSGIGVAHSYSRGYLSAITDTATGTALQTFSDMDAFGNMKTETYGNGVVTSRAFDAKTGRLTDIDTGSGGTTIQDNRYKWRSNGMLESRFHVNNGITIEEAFIHDNLDRLIQARTYELGSGGNTLRRVLNTLFDKRGNIEQKSIWHLSSQIVYQYAPDKNRLTSFRRSGVDHTLSYDANGNITEYDRNGSGDDKYIDWNPRNLPEKVLVGASRTDLTPTASDEFAYGPDGQRFYKKSVWDDNGTQKTEHTFYVGSFEELVTDASDTAVKEVHKSRVGDNILHIKEVDRFNVSTYSIEYLHRDHLGSVERVTDESGNQLRALAYDPYGERRRADWMDLLTGSETDALADDLRTSTSRGFTGHESLDRTGFIHMNGRIYDPELGRFLSPDPIVQSPGFSQSWNRYSYVMNSPLSYTDPSGFVRQSASGLCRPPVCLNATGPDGSSGSVGGSTSVQMPFTQTRVSYDRFVYITLGPDRFQLDSRCFDCYGMFNLDFGFGLATEIVYFEQSVDLTRSIKFNEGGETDEPSFSAHDAALFVMPGYDFGTCISRGNCSFGEWLGATFGVFPGGKGVAVGIRGILKVFSKVPVGAADDAARSSANAARLRGQLAGDEIAGGHAFEKHVIQRGEFTGLGIRTREQFARHIENVVNNPSASRQLSGGRTAFWDDATGTVVIRNPRAADGGTAFRPTAGREYFEGLR